MPTEPERSSAGETETDLERIKPHPMKNGPLTWTSKLQTLPYWDIPLLFTNCIIQSWEVHHHADNSWWESCIRMPFWWWIWATSWASLVAHMVKNPPEIWETWVWSLGWEEPLEEAMAPTPVFSPRESPWTEEPGGLQSMGSQRIRHDQVNKCGTAHPRSVFEWVSQSLRFGGRTGTCCALCRGPQHVLRTLEEDPVRFHSQQSWETVLRPRQAHELCVASSQETWVPEPALLPTTKQIT